MERYVLIHDIILVYDIDRLCIKNHTAHSVKK